MSEKGKVLSFQQQQAHMQRVGKLEVCNGFGAFECESFIKMLLVALAAVYEISVAL